MALVSAMRYEFEDTFDGDALDEQRWVPQYLPQRSSRGRSAARYEVGGGRLRLRIEADQQPWCPEFDGEVRVSSLQTVVFTGPVGSKAGQHRFAPEAVVREAQENVRLYTPRYGRIELRARTTDDHRCMVALWMIGYEDEPERSAEICACEIFGRGVSTDHAAVGMGVYLFGDPRITDDFAAERVPIDAREFHVYAAEWTPEQVEFFIDDERIKSVGQSPSYPMQLTLSLYEFPDGAGDRTSAGSYPKEFVVDYARGYRLVPGRAGKREGQVAIPEAPPTALISARSGEPILLPPEVRPVVEGSLPGSCMIPGPSGKHPPRDRGR